MKRLVFTLAMLMVLGHSFGQKKVLNSAKNELKGNSPNFTEARRLIKEALENPETKDLAETWFVAGQIEDKQLNAENTKEMLGQQPNLAVMYEALSNILPYFEKAYEIDQAPDKKGKVKPKFTKDILSTIKANRLQYINAGLHYYNGEDFKKAYVNFKLYGDIPDLPMMQGEIFPTIENGDSIDLQIRYYAGLSASLIPDHEAAIAIYNEVKDKGFDDFEVFQRLVYEYEQVGDTTSMEKVLKEGMDKYPESDFIMSLINISINKGKVSEAIIYLNDAVGKFPQNAQLFDVLGLVYEGEKNYDKAIENLEKALKIEPNNLDYLFHAGRVLYNEGVETRGKADENVSNTQLYEQELKKSKDYFRQAMPYFQKVFELDQNNYNAISALRTIYYNLNMDEFEKMDEIYMKIVGEE